MAIVVLVRHGRSSANAEGILAGRLPGVALDEEGQRQATAVGVRLADADWVDLVASPLQRCQETAFALASAHGHPHAPVTLDGLNECDYGQWQGRSLKELSKEPLWSTIQKNPSEVTFPGGEAMTQMQERAVRSVRGHDAMVTQRWGSDAVWVAVSHGDVIKSVLADALGMHLDHFQRLQVDPASVSIIRSNDQGRLVVAMNTHGGDLSWLKAGGGADQPGAVAPGGGAGPAPTDPEAQDLG